ncbi:hypothetical protein KIS4809_1593 [Bacillus sp. ZZV12-4809]|nr:hypothetical protein KIS4809_1593 [Bacillus sp. ZZV12-4809]
MIISYSYQQLKPRKKISSLIKEMILPGISLGVLVFTNQVLS